VESANAGNAGIGWSLSGDCQLSSKILVFRESQRLFLPAYHHVCKHREYIHNTLVPLTHLMAQYLVFSCVGFVLQAVSPCLPTKTSATHTLVEPSHLSVSKTRHSDLGRLLHSKHVNWGAIVCITQPHWHCFATETTQSALSSSPELGSTLAPTLAELEDGNFGTQALRTSFSCHRN
jgi:hypothetical protein